MVVYGNGSQTRDFVNVHDAVEAALAAVEKENVEEVEGQVFNVGSGKPTSVNELAKAVLELAGADLMVKYEAPRAGDIRRSYADVSKAGRLLGFKPQVGLREGLRALLAEAAVSASC